MMEEAVHVGGQGLCGNSVFSTQLCYEPKATKKEKKVSRKISKQNTEYICVWLYLHEKLLKVPPKLIKVVTYDGGRHETDGDGGGNKTFYYTPSTFF